MHMIRVWLCLRKWYVVMFWLGLAWKPVALTWLRVDLAFTWLLLGLSHGL